MKYAFSTQPIERLGSLVAQVRVTQEKESYVVREGSRTIVSLGVEDPKKLTQRDLVLLSRRAIVLAKGQKVKSLAFSLGDFIFSHLKMTEGDLGELLVTNFEMANYEFVQYKTSPKEGWDFVEEVVVCGKISKEAKKGIERGKMIGEEVNNLINGIPMKK